MPQPLRLLCVLAHPDDETLGAGGILARYAAEGVETYLVTATRGEKGWKLGDYPGPDAVGRHRSRELRAAAKVLGIRQVCFLGYPDGELDQARPEAVTGRIARHLQAIRPQVVVTFGPDGAYGHPDHIAISQFTSAAVLEAAKGPQAHLVSKLYHLAWTKAQLADYQTVFGELKARVDGGERRFSGWDDWAITTRVETGAFALKVREAILCHQSQLRDYQGLLAAPERTWQALYGQQTFYRAFSLVSGGRELEIDLFTGLR